MKKVLLGLFCAVLAMTGCAQLNPLGSVEDDSGALGFAMNTDPAQEIATGTVTVTKGGMTFTRPIVIANYTGTVTLSGLQVGRWNILVQLYDAEGYEIYTGEAQAVVNKNQTTTARIRVNQNTGTLQVIVEVPGLVLDLGLDSAADLLTTTPPGVVSGGSWETARTGNGFKSDATGEGILFSYDTATAPSMDAGTVEFWFRPDYPMVNGRPTYGNGAVPFYINVNPGTAGADSRLLYMVMHPTYGFGFAFAKHDGTYTTSVNNTSVSWNAGDWVHIAAVWDKNGFDGGKTMAIFVDGVEVASTTAAMVFTAPVKIETLLFGNIAGNLDRSARGLIDDLKLLNYAKTDFSDRF